MGYLVIARKYRPQTFDEVVGQEHITNTLKNAILKDRVAHSYLFTGTRGVGKTTTARIFAKALNCVNAPTVTPCNECDSCVSITNGSSMDVIEIDGASNRGIDEIRNLRENVKFASTNGKYKIYIIDEVHMLTTEAFNALLKTLEEPPAHVKFIFATTASYKVPVTILSRCQRFDYRNIPTSIIVQRLESICNDESLNAEPQALYAIAETADGSMRDSQSLLDQISNFCGDHITYEKVQDLLGLIGDEKFFEIAGKIKERDAASLIEFINNELNAGVEPLQFINGLANFFRLLLVTAVGGKAMTTIEKPKEYLEKLQQCAPQFTQHDLLYLLQLIVETRNVLKRTELGRLALEMLMVKMTLKEDLTSLDSIMNELSSLEQTVKTKQPVENRQMRNTSYSPVPNRSAVQPQQSRPQQSVQSSAQQPVQKEPVVLSPVEPAVVVSGSIQEAWPAIIAGVKSEKPSCGAYLEHVHITDVNDKKVSLGISEEMRFHKEMLETTANKELLEQIIQKHTGNKYHIEFTLVKKPPTVSAQTGEIEPPKEEKSKQEQTREALESDMVKGVLSSFEGEIRDISH